MQEYPKGLYTELKSIELHPVFNTTWYMGIANDAEEEKKMLSEGFSLKMSDASKEKKKDDLTELSGIGETIANKLKGIQITTFAQIAALTEQDAAEIDDLLNFKGRIDRENWIEQAQGKL
tara:strand:+ start:943 stop:1302 length:360 start_codon:yes stop_codon:yes gene_type:complete